MYVLAWSALPCCPGSSSHLPEGGRCTALLQLLLLYSAPNCAKALYGKVVQRPRDMANS